MTETQQKKYFDSFTGDSPNDESRISKALAFAHDARKFEIDLYWRRAAYFWAFSAATFGAYIAVLSAKNLENKPQALLLVSCLGLVFSVAWYFVNRASKYWQLNWELHVDLLENEEIGPIYKTVMNDNPSLISIAAAYPFSVSKINQLLSFFVVLIFSFLLIDTLLQYYKLSTNWEFFPTACLIITFGALISFFYFGRVSSKPISVIATLRKTSIKSYEEQSS